MKEVYKKMLSRQLLEGLKNDVYKKEEDVAVIREILISRGYLLDETSGTFTGLTDEQVEKVESAITAIIESQKKELTDTVAEIIENTEEYSQLSAYDYERILRLEQAIDNPSILKETVEKKIKQPKERKGATMPELTAEQTAILESTTFNKKEKIVKMFESGLTRKEVVRLKIANPAYTNFLLAPLEESAKVEA